MPIKVIALCMFLSMVFSLHAFKEEDIILVDTLYAELSLTNSIFYNMQTDAYMYYPHYTVLEISYGRSGFGAPGIIEGRGVASFQIPPLPMGYHIQSDIFQAYCEWYWDNSSADVWPRYYSTPYQVLVDHIQFDAILPVVFGQNALASNVAVLQDSAYIGWIGTDVTSSYLDDLQQSRTYSQYRLHFPPGYDVTGYQVDLVYYARPEWGTPKIIITYQKDVSNSDEVSPSVSSIFKRLYPMPVFGVLNIELDDKYRNSARLNLYDLRGRHIATFDKLNNYNNPVQLQLPECPSGIYFLKVEANQKSEIRKITIIR